MHAQNFKLVIVIFVIKGTLPNSAYTATFEAFVCTPRICLQNFKCSFSAKVRSDFLYYLVYDNFFQRLNVGGRNKNKMS